MRLCRNTSVTACPCGMHNVMLGDGKIKGHKLNSHLQKREESVFMLLIDYKVISVQNFRFYCFI